MSKKIFFVDDEVNVLKAFKWVFADEPYDIFTFDSPLKALKEMEKTEVAVIVSDLRMPEMEGTTLLEKVSIKWPDTVRILLTAHADLDTAIAGINKGNVFQFIRKPWDEKDLVLSVSKAFAHYELISQNIMLLQLVKKKNDQLEDLNKNLEKIVTEQTKEIKQSEERLKQTLTDLRKSMGGAIQAITQTVEVRDPYTAGHQRRATDLARSIAVEMGLSGKEINGIRMAGSIHDLGKIAIPAEILSKPTQLNQAEFMLIKTHPTVGYDILKNIEFKWPVAQIVLQHHERINNSGYPQGLTAEEILLEAKILAVADVVEAMSSHRPYRPALGINKALEEILKNRGVLYDPHVTDACLRLFREKKFQFRDMAEK